MNSKVDTAKQFFNKYSKSRYLSHLPILGYEESKAPKVSIIIPTLNNLKAIKTLLDSIFILTEYPNYEVLLVDNGSEDSDVISYYQELGQIRNLKILNYRERFNYSRALNLGASDSDGEIILFLNNDMQVLNPAWLSEMVKWVMIPEVGVVGTKLLRLNHTIQHAGIVIGLQGFVGHVNLNVPDHFLGLTGSVDWTRNISAVTGACQMMRREVFLELGGYDENFQLVFSDVDFCLRAIDRGYRVVYAPTAALIHHEGKSRGYKTPVNDILYGYEKMGYWLEKDDPYFSPNLTYTTIPKCELGNNSAYSRLENIRIRKKAIVRISRFTSLYV